MAAASDETIPSGIYSLVYTSTATRPVDESDLLDLLNTSRRNNAEIGVTGLLLYRSGRFIQFLEGARSDVQGLLAKIAADQRHENFRVVVDGDAASRQFPEWTMGYHPAPRSPESLPDGFRSTLDDLKQIKDPDAVVRAARELSMWFHVRNSHE